MNLHKLSGESRKTVMNQDSPVSKGYLFGKDTLFPVEEEAADDIAAVAFVNGRVMLHKAFPSFPVFMRGNDINVFFDGYQ